jgi:hypothetical protein
LTDPFRPSVFTPFFRRFTDEAARDTRDTKALYERVQRMHQASPYRGEEGQRGVRDRIEDEFFPAVPDDLLAPFRDAVDDILSLESAIFRLPQEDFAHLSLKEATDLRRFLRAKEHFHAHEEKVIGLLVHYVGLALAGLAMDLPETAAPSPFTIPLLYVLPEPKTYMQRVINEMALDKYADAGLFAELSQRLYRNACEASGVDPSNPKKAIKGPYDSDLPLDELAKAFFSGTPFLDLLETPVPLRFTHEERFSHMHVLGGSGAGKTTLLQNLILHDLQSENPPSLVIVDSQGDLINKLSRLAVFDPDHGALADRLVLITPKDIKHPPAINIFDVNRDRLDQYNEAAKEQVVAGVIQTFDYLFAGLLGADLTAKQGVFFRFVARLLLALPETMCRSATILDMLALMDDAAPYKAAIASLPPIQRQFFERDFASKTFAQTKEQIRYRLNAVLENPTLARLFTAPTTRIDLFDTLNNGGIVLVDTAKDFLKGASAHFGRIFISLALQAILERAAIPEHQRRPTFLVVDEAAAYFDSNIDDFLTEARKYKCGCVFAHQFLDQASSALRASLAANTSIKFASGVSTGDARALASDMRATSEFILGQSRLHFAAHVRGVTPSAVSIPVPVGRLERQPRLSDAAYERLRQRNRARVSLPPEASAPRRLPAPESATAWMDARGDDAAGDDPTRAREW